jgi:membrane fusion protein, multidrug efflux system
MARAVEQDVRDREEVQTKVSGPAGKKEEFNSREPRVRWSRWIVLFVSGMAATAATLWWLYSRNHESTDDTQVDGHVDVISTRISGTVAYVNPRVENNQFVTASTLLLELDPRDYQAELEHAQANLVTATAEDHAAFVNVPIVDASAFGQLHAAEAAKEQSLATLDAEQANFVAAQHKLQQDEAIYARAERDRVRYQALVEKHEISRSDYDARQTEAAADAHGVEADRSAAAAAQQRVSEARSQNL